ncbi:MAG TPA: hypothetical protein VGO62_12975, partial [Myxococcota bacterium]
MTEAAALTWREIVDMRADLADEVLCGRAAAAAGALADVALLQFVHLDLVDALARRRKRALAQTERMALLAQIGASPKEQRELSSSPSPKASVKVPKSYAASAAAYALTLAVGE